MNISDELERILGDMDEDEKRKAEESNTAKQMALLAEGGTPTGATKKTPTGANDLIHELRAQMYGADPANTNMPTQQDFATQLMQYLSHIYFPGLVQQGQANVPTAAQSDYADVPSHANGGSIGYHQPGALEDNMLALGGHRALPIIMALHKAAGGTIDGATQSPKPESPSADDSGGLFDPEMFGVPTGAVAANDALEREYQSARANPMQYGSDVLNRGMIAGLAGAPVDMTNEVLKQFGLGSEKPFGGSESIGSGMESMGLVSPERHMVGELSAGLVDPFSTAATGAKLAHGMTAMMPLMTAYHGTPHKFEAFDASKIGTGEGAQAYGHGLYFAEVPDLAQAYANKLTKVNGQAISDQLDSRTKYLDMLKQQAASGDANAEKNIPIIEKSISDLVNQGSVYEVHIPDEHIDKMLNWDRPLSEQPHILNLKNPNGNGSIHDYLNFINAKPEDFAGADLMFNMGLRQKPQKAEQISHWFSNQGVPGVKYFDQSSRGTGKGTTRNFVIFPGNEDKLKILSRNGEPVNP
jgi:DNA-binding FrmR family transcriptional regulator